MGFAIDLAANEGWNPGLFDTDIFFGTDPGAFLIGFLGGKPVGCISAVSYTGGFGFIGFYIVLPEYRGRGVGFKLWERALERLDDHNIGLDGVFEQQDNYSKSGFKLAYRNIRFEYRFRQMEAPPKAQILNASDVQFDLISEYDRLCFPVERETFLSNWLKMPQSHAFVYAGGNRLEGYGLIRKCRVGYKVGPLFADDKDKALALFMRLCSCVEPGHHVYLDVPEVNSAGIELAGELETTKVFGTARMYTGALPDIRTDKIYGVTTFELG